MCPSVSRGALLCPENREKRGKERGNEHWPLGQRKVERNRMKMTNKDKAGKPDDFDGGTYTPVVWNECFATNTRRVRTKTDERALAAGGAQ